VPARVDWLEALIEGDETFTERFGIAVASDWAGFPEAVPYALDGVRRQPGSEWGAQLFFDTSDGALIGFGGFKDAPRDGEVELGYAVAPERQGRGIATAVVSELVTRARSADVRVVTAHTLAVEGPSTAVLRKNGFRNTAQIDDPEEGSIWRWELDLR
jgi:RimJ/RimL family protein N-acetyltransferase